VAGNDGWRSGPPAIVYYGLPVSSQSSKSTDRGTWTTAETVLVVKGRQVAGKA